MQQLSLLLQSSCLVAAELGSRSQAPHSRQTCGPSARHCHPVRADNGPVVLKIAASCSGAAALMLLLAATDLLLTPARPQCLPSCYCRTMLNALRLSCLALRLLLGASGLLGGFAGDSWQYYLSAWWQGRGQARSRVQHSGRGPYAHLFGF